MMDTKRLVLLFIFGFSLLMLWDAWEKEHRPRPAPQAPQASSPAVMTAAGKPAATQGTSAGSVPATAATTAEGKTIEVRTDVIVADIDTLGATLSRVELLKYKETMGSDKSLVLLGPEHHYEAQSGITGDGGPNHRTIWNVQPGNTTLAAGQDALEVRFTAQGKDGLSATKIYRFKRDSYLIDVTLEISNTGTAPLTPYAYFQLTHDGKSAAAAHSIADSFGARSFNGFAIYTEEKKFQKIPPTDIDKDKADYIKQSSDGWLAFVEHYFVSAWVPAAKIEREFAVEKRADGLYAGRELLSTGPIAPGASTRLDVQLYAGPQERNRLAAVAPGFDLVVDYGWLTIIAWPLFWLLEKYHSLSGNWGVAIILLTMTIKLVFFPLSAASYKSMAKMKLVTPRMTKIRQMYEHDRAKMNQAMMELYKTEKINPLGGCFPIVVQIPVFIALYWVLLAAIELRHAPFMLWIQDLSARDPYYVLPILMTITMVLQTKMNPVPPDPVQAKVMQFMPFIFSVFFFFFPAGLVLYWLVNNTLSILQQWQIQRMFARDKPAHARR